MRICTVGRGLVLSLVLSSLWMSTLGIATGNEPTDRDLEQRSSLNPQPTPRGLEYRRLTPIDPQEEELPAQHYQWLLDRIRAGTADNRVMRQHYWLKQRIVPWPAALQLGWQIPVADALQQRDPAPPRRASDAATLPVYGRWINVGPTTIPGRVTGLARPAGRSNELLAAMADGGLWRSRDNGVLWEPLTEREATQASGAVAVDPRNPEIYYWATGEGNGAIDNYGGIGVLKTTDAGRTWTRSNHFSGSFRGLTVNRHAPNEVWAAGDRLFRSLDGGANFARVFGGTPENGAVGVLIHPTNPQKLWATFWGPGVYRSEDAGDSWVPQGNGLPSPTGRTEIAICAADPRVMYVYGEIGGGDLWKTVDGGASWSAVFTTSFDPCGGQCWYDMSLAVAPDDCNTVYLGGVDAFVSRNGGANWTSVGASGSYVHVDHHAMLVGPGGEVVMGSDGGVFRSTNYATTFTPIGLGLPTTQYYGACGSDVESQYYFGGTQDNGSHRHRSSDGWAWLLGGDGGMCAVGGDKILGEYQVTNLTRSIDGGASWGDANGGIDNNDPRSWVGIIEKDPSDPNTLYVGTHKVYRTLDFKATAWKMILNQVYFGRQVSALAVSPADRNVLWVGHEVGGLYKSTNATAASGVSFENVKRDLPNRTIRRVQPHPTQAHKAWIVLAGYGNPRLMYTADGGGSYVDRTGDLPDLPVNDLVIDPGDENVLLAATDLGVFKSIDGGSHWFGHSDGLPTTAVIEMFRHPASGQVVAGTHGRSMYVLRPAAAGAVAVPDGAQIPGRPLLAELTSSGQLWLRWDTAACTAPHYHLFYATPEQFAAGSYGGASCDLPRGGEAVVTMPGSATQTQFFLIATSGDDGISGPHGFASSGATRPHTGIGLCGVTGYNAAENCP
jgi:photosystem II stability/assembly factor-like uncharacterized protein